MKINKFNLGLTLLTVAGMFVACQKPKENIAPEPDTEVQTALDATWATYAITDIEMMCAYLGENQPLIHPYMQVPGTEGSMGPGTGSTVPLRSGKHLAMGFNKTKCLDGRLRSGTVDMYYEIDTKRKPGANANSEYYHDYGFSCEISLLSYQVDHYLVKNVSNTARILVWNELATPSWTASKPLEDIQWSLAGDFIFEHDSVPNKNIVYKANIWKVLRNTNDKKVFDINRTPAINFSISTCGYWGEQSGMTNSIVPFRMSIKKTQALERDFTCMPDRVAAVKTTTVPKELEIRNELHHPFIKGVASFTTGTKYPRQIYFGNESNTSLAAQCDITGEVMIKGIAYKVNFMK